LLIPSCFYGLFLIAVGIAFNSFFVDTKHNSTDKEHYIHSFQFILCWYTPGWCWARYVYSFYFQFILCWYRFSSLSHHNQIRSLSIHSLLIHILNMGRNTQRIWVSFNSFFVDTCCRHMLLSHLLTSLSIHSLLIHNFYRIRYNSESAYFQFILCWY